MKANELQKQIRIGNYLLGKCIDDLDDRKEWWEIYKIQDAEHLMGIKENWDKPIELTEEILLKCGFVKNASSYSKMIINFIDIEINIQAELTWLKERTIMHVEHLHQLQNLYFALTGQELEINL